MPRHILHLARLYAPHKGGVETHVAALAQLEIAQGDRVSVITSQNDPNLPLQEIIQGVEIKRIPFAAQQSKLKTWQWIVAQKAIQSADIVQVHDVFWWLWPVYFSVRGKVFMTFHGWEGVYPVRWQAKMQRYLASKLSRGSIHVGAWIQEFYWDKPSAVTYGAIDAEVLAIHSVEADVSVPKIVFIGRLEEANEIESYLQLFAHLKSQMPKLEITWIGDGPYRPQCEKLGSVTGMMIDPWSHAKDATLVCANSYLSMLNSQALGKVVVGLYTNKLKQRYLETYPGKAAMIIGDNPATIATQIVTLCQNPRDLQARSAAAREFAQTQTWTQVAKIYETLWTRKSL